MIKGISMGQYLPACSPVHRLDPRAKLLCTVMAVPAVLVTYNTIALVLVSMWVLLAAAFSGIKPGVYWSSLKPLWVLLLVSFVLQVFFTPGEAVLTAWFIKISREGLVNSGWLLWRISVLLIAAAALTFTTTPLQLTAALEWLLSPLRRVKVPVRELVMMINLALRFVPTLFDEARQLLLAQRSRGADFTRGGIKERAGRLAPFIVPLLANIFSRADELALAMEIRCYEVGARRSRMHVLRFGPADYTALLVTMAVVLAVAAMRVL
ncbi:energy-coupling factor transporter transmembrane component T family protein [Desulfallas thermosapovorans]|uniref:Energy-coupling factor transport system permease protein n=1 Tax=Desulfallas thermosapovorans DSM 6562 TaxID=1121431 RepID=A0A5S4ZQJ6_9FIRM|nr:energy-coupling factor transporter transmembrane component T [Desulfallas thermosapovorans]TYO93815.1 energy-coupling factor transport system permease protein [Desulfallas thermosapovorans DSM 6562]